MSRRLTLLGSSRLGQTLAPREQARRWLHRIDEHFPVFDPSAAFFRDHRDGMTALLRELSALADGPVKERICSYFAHRLCATQPDLLQNELEAGYRTAGLDRTTAEALWSPSDGLVHLRDERRRPGRKTRMLCGHKTRADRLSETLGPPPESTVVRSAAGGNGCQRCANAARGLPAAGPAPEADAALAARRERLLSEWLRRYDFAATAEEVDRHWDRSRGLRDGRPKNTDPLLVRPAHPLDAVSAAATMSARMAVAPLLAAELSAVGDALLLTHDLTSARSYREALAKLPDASYRLMDLLEPADLLEELDPLTSLQYVSVDRRPPHWANLASIGARLSSRAVLMDWQADENARRDLEARRHARERVELSATRERFLAGL